MMYCESSSGSSSTPRAHSRHRGCTSHSGYFIYISHCRPMINFILADGTLFKAPPTKRSVFLEKISESMPLIEFCMS